MTENLLPHPRVYRPYPGRFPIGRSTAVTGDANVAGVVRQTLARVPWPPLTQADEPGDIRVELATALHPEGYRLLIGPSHMRILAGGPEGACYAAQTIRQLLPDAAWRHAPTAGGQWSVGCAEIEDYPATRWRGAHLDVSRHFFPKPVLLAFIDMLAAHKLNRLHLHLTDDQGWRVESRRYPALCDIGAYRPSTQVGKDPSVQDGIPHGGYYTLADLAEIHAYARHRMVTVVPEIDLPGHTRALLAALPELAAAPGTRELTVATEWGIFPHILAPLPPALEVLTGLFEELLAAVPAPFVHIGGDECVLTDWEADPRIAAYQAELGLASPAALHAFFLRQVADLLAGRFGARAIVWDEGFTSTAAGAALRPDTVVMAWHGMEVACRAAQAGYDVIAAPQLPLYFDNAQDASAREPLSVGGVVTARDVAAFDPAPGDWPQEALGRLLGAQFQLWSEYIRDARVLDYMAYPRAAIFAEVAWTGRPATWTGGDLPLLPRVEAHLRRLDAAGVEYRPLAGPRPWQAAR